MKNLVKNKTELALIYFDSEFQTRFECEGICIPAYPPLSEYYDLEISIATLNGLGIEKVLRKWLRTADNELLLNNESDTLPPDLFLHVADKVRVYLKKNSIL